MDFLAVGIFLVVCFDGILGQVADPCQPVKAEVCLRNRTKEYNDVVSKLAANPGVNAEYHNLCITQVQSYESCFHKETKQCNPDDIKIMKAEWDNLSQNITNLCLKECPSMLEVANCKNLTDTSDLRKGIFETFCRSFNSSLRCAKEVINECAFGTKFYADLYQATIIQYWRYICNSGCHNLDDTVIVITNCAEHLQGVTADTLCRGHGLFKQCVSNATHVCNEVMKIVRFKYKQYDVVDKQCMTTTTQSTQPTTTSTTVTVTYTPEISTTPDFGECIEGVDQNMLDVSENVEVEQILLLLQIESCIHNKTSYVHSMGELTEILGPKFATFYQTVKQQGWTVLQESQRQCAASKESSKGCSGHRYGLLACNTGLGLLSSFSVLLLTATATIFV